MIVPLVITGWCLGMVVMFFLVQRLLTQRRSWNRMFEDEGSAAGLVALGRSVPTGDLARPPLRQPEPFDDHPNGVASAGRAQTFPRAISFNAWFSSN